MYLDGQRLPPLSPSTALAKGIALVPADRAVQGLIQSFPIREDLTLPWLAPLIRYTCILPGRERKDTLQWIDKVQVVPREPERPAGQLSGGNQQKVVIAKSLRIGPKILVLDDPTQGVDVGAKAAIHRLLLDVAASGAAVILCSVEADDLVGLCDRVLVLRDGRVVAELADEEVSEHQLLLTTLRIDACSAAAPEDFRPMSQASPHDPTPATNSDAAIAPAAPHTKSDSRLALETPRDPVFTTSNTADAATMGSNQRSATGFEFAVEWAIRSFQNFSAVYILAALIILFGVWMPSTFLTATTLKTLLPQQAVTRHAIGRTCGCACRRGF